MSVNQRQISRRLTRMTQINRIDVAVTLIRVNLRSSAANSYGTSMIKSFPANVKFGRRRPFMYFAAVCESAVMMIGSAIVA